MINQFTASATRAFTETRTKAFTGSKSAENQILSEKRNGLLAQNLKTVFFGCNNSLDNCHCANCLLRFLSDGLRKPQQA